MLKVVVEYRHSMTDKRLNFTLDEGSDVESYTLLYIYERFGVSNVQKVVRDNDCSDVPFCIGDFGDLSVELCAGHTYTNFCDDDNVPLTGGPRFLCQSLFSSIRQQEQALHYR